MQITEIATSDIDADALPRDRSALEGDRLDELIASIAATGIRLPLEVARTDQGLVLVSGYRRLTAARRLGLETVPAVILSPGSLARALALMVEENAVRADISPWDQGRIAVAARDDGHFDTLDAAIRDLYPSASRQKRARLRALASVAEEFGGILIEPLRYSQNRLHRMAAAMRAGFTDLMLGALTDLGPDAAERDQWEALDAICGEAEALAAGHLKTQTSGDRPRRRIRPRPALTIRREWRKGGWTLVFSGREAREGLIEDIMDQIERDYGTS